MTVSFLCRFILLLEIVLIMKMVKAFDTADVQGINYPGVNGNGGNVEGPLITKEPEDVVHFSNTTGVRLECEAKGKPEPSITWITSDGLPVGSVTGLRILTTEGTLVLLPFKAEEFRQDIHDVVYKCSASNSVGTVVGKDIHVKAVISQPYEIYVHDTYVIPGNDGLLRCNVRSHVSLGNYINVTAWFKNDSYIINNFDNNEDDKYSFFPTGDLLIRNVDTDDHDSKFKCKTFNRLTNASKFSQTQGRLIITVPDTTKSPRIIRPKLEYSLLEGSPLFVPCIAEGYPVPHIQWSKKNSSNFMTPFPYLNIKSVRKSDNGNYVCRANNSIGQDTVEISVNIIDVLDVEVLPKRMIAHVGTSTEIACKIDGNPSSVNWLHNGHLISTGKEFIVSRNSLTILKISSLTKGMYQCLAKLNKMSAHDSMEIKLGDSPPEFSTVFKETVLTPGNSLSISCSVSGSPTPTVQWYLDDKLIKSDDALITQDSNVISWLNISVVTPKDGGVYTCKATNKVGTIKYSERINIYGPLSIHDVTLTAIYGDTIDLHCPVSGYPIKRIIWEKGNVELPNDVRQMKWKNGTLTISDIQTFDDRGMYECTAEDMLGNKVKGYVHVKVLVPPEINPINFEEVHLQEGMIFEVFCAVTRGDLPLNISWLKDNLPIPSHLPVSIKDFDEYSRVLSIDPVTLQHSGNYSCVARNHIGTDSKTAALTVYVPPQWIVSPNDTEVVKGSSLIINCQADGLPKPTIEWEKVIGKLHMGDRIRITAEERIDILSNGSLFFKNISKTDEGFYFCYASNGKGIRISVPIYITVKVPVHFNTKSLTQISRLNLSTVLSCEVSGDSPIQFLWKRNGKEIDVNRNRSFKKTSNGAISNLTIEKVRKEDEGIYTCTASNLYGNASLQIQLKVEESLGRTSLKVPDVPVLEIISKTMNSIGFQWKSNDEQVIPIQSYIFHYQKARGQWEVKEFQADTHGYVLDNLSCGTTYHFYLKARNDVGTSEPSEILTVKTESGSFQLPPTSDLIHVGSTFITVHLDSWPSTSCPVEYFELEYKQLSSSEWTVVSKNIKPTQKKWVISNLRPGNRYVLRMSAVMSESIRRGEYQFATLTLGGVNREVNGNRHMENDKLLKLPPDVPILQIYFKTMNSIGFQWKSGDERGYPIRSYIFHYRKQTGQWKVKEFPADTHGSIFNNVSCDATYQFYLEARNDVGTSKPTEIITVKPNPDRFRFPLKSHLIHVGPTFITVHLDSWPSTSCPVKYFLLEYKQISPSARTFVSKNIKPTEKKLVIPNLLPATWYALRLTAVMSESFSRGEYHFATLTLPRGTFPTGVKGGVKN